MKQVANVFYETCLVYKFYATLLTNKEEMQMMKSNRKSKNIILSWKPYQKRKTIQLRYCTKSIHFLLIYAG
jgi:hypothetical protein